MSTFHPARSSDTVTPYSPAEQSGRAALETYRAVDALAAACLAPPPLAPALTPDNNALRPQLLGMHVKDAVSDQQRQTLGVHSPRPRLNAGSGATCAGQHSVASGVALPTS